MSEPDAMIEPPAAPESDATRLAALEAKLGVLLKAASDDLREEAEDAAAIAAERANPAAKVPGAVALAIGRGTPPLRAWREHRGLTQAALAAGAGTHTQYVSQIERGERSAGPGVLRAMADALDAPTEALTAD